MTSRSTARLRTTMTRALCASVVAGGALLGLGGHASAQFAFEEEILPPRVVAWRLADRGFTGLSRPRFDGRVYVVDAVNPAGIPVRLLVDPTGGAIIGRQRVGAPETYARLERPAPGFGWTEDDAAPRRVVRPSPFDEPPALRLQRRPAGEALRPEPNPDGVNPDSVGRTAPPRKVARAAPARPADLRPALRNSPEVPAPKAVPADSGRTDAKADTKTGGKPETRDASIEKAQPATSPAPTAEKPAEKVVAEAPKPDSKDWKDPPTDKKPVRVIGGATIVPGTVEKEPGAAQ
ncbi:hypothetical protein [Methylobacterium mesophilicum]|nr:hypothetical protein [Methylobacterium mesophilicum]